MSIFKRLRQLFRETEPYKPNPCFQSGRVIRNDRPWYHDPNEFKALKEKANATAAASGVSHAP